MMNKKLILILMSMVLLLSGCTSKSVFKNEITEDITPVAVNVPAELNPGKYSELPNEKNGWGLKKNKNAPPEIPAKTVEILNKYGAVYKDSEPHALYLTFDEGYENGYTPKILDVL